MSRAVGKSCVDTIKRSRQNVAIATQVLSPSAIGGSLRGQRRLKHFGPPDDDEEEFIFYRRRAAWKKLGYYGLAIAITIFVLMGTILVVGYLQTQSKTSSLQVSRSVKLIQDAKPASYMYTSKTTPDPPSLEPTDSQEYSPTTPQSSFLRSFAKDDSEDKESLFNQNGHIYFSPSDEPSSDSSNNGGEDHYLPDYNLEGDSYNTGYDEVTVKVNTSFLVNHENKNHDEDNHDDHTNHSHADHETNETFGSNNKANSEERVVTIEKERVDNDVSSNNGDWKSDDAHVIVEIPIIDNEENKDEMPIKEKALPPQDTVFSLEIPIYTNNKSSLAMSKHLAEEINFVEESEPVVEHNVSSEIKNDDASKIVMPLENAYIEITTEEPIKHRSKIPDKYLEEMEQEFAKDGSETLNNENFHKTILHTALFHLDEEKVKKASPSATAILIQDHDDIEDTTPNSAIENFKESHEATSKTNGTKKLKVKILKNDQVMNMKSTFTPPEKRAQQSSEEIGSLSSSEKKVAEILHSSNAEGRRKQVHRPRNRNFLNGTRNKTASDWKLKLRVNKPKKYGGGLEGTAFDSLNVFSHPTGLPFNFGESESRGSSSFEEKPRLLAASGFMPSFESFLKAILSNVQQVNSNGKTPKNRFSNNNQMFHTTEHPLQEAPSEFGNSFANSIDHLLPTASTTLSSPILELDPTSQFRQYPTVGAIGNPSATGATLSNNFQLPTFPPLSSFSTAATSHYDINPSGSNDKPELVPGMVPLNLASSYMPAAGFGLSNNPYTGQGQHNQNSGYGLQNPFGNNYNADLSTFSFPNSASPSYGNSPLDNIGSITTASGTAPTYNTIAQGMHLLNMISGTVPSTYYHDQVYHSSQPTPTSYQNDGFSLSSPAFQFSTTPPTNDFSTSTNFVPAQSFDFSKFSTAPPSSPPPPPPSFSLPPYDYHPPEESSGGQHNSIRRPQQILPPPLSFLPRPMSLKSDREALEKFLQEDNDNDQEPAASSFSQNILTTFKKNKPTKDKKKVGASDQIPTTTAGSIITLMTKPKMRTTNLFRIPPKPTTSTKSFSFEILPHKNLTSKNYLSPFANTAIFDGLNEVGSANDPIGDDDDGSSSRSKKKSGANLNIPIWKSLPPDPIPSYPNSANIDPRYYSSGINHPKNNHELNSKVNAEKKSTKPAHYHGSAIGLKSGFFT